MVIYSLLDFNWEKKKERMPAAGKDYYQVLGISRDADEEAIKSAYKKNALKWHPDRNLDKKEEAERRFKELAEAYEVLSDKQKRAVYDQYGEAGLKGVPMDDGGAQGGFAGGFPAGGFQFRSSGAHGADDIFSQFFASQGIDPFATFGFGGGRSRGGRSGMDGMGGMGGFTYMDTDNMPQGGPTAEELTVKKRLACSLEELYTGTTKKLKVTRRRMDGQSEEKVLVVNVKPGWKAGTKITFNNEGDEVSPNTFQNIIFTLEEKPHSVFKREGDDLTCTLDISLLEALAGFSKPIKALDGKRNIQIESKEVVEPTTARRIPGEGMPNSKSGRKGDLIVKFNIKFPKSLSSTQKEKLSAVL